MKNARPENAKTRFSDRVENYVKYRPHYPAELIAILAKQVLLVPEWVIADVGSGTGISSELFVRNGNTVYGVEPNEQMRLAAEDCFGQESNFISVNGSSEVTTLESNSVDLVISGQALHWFDIKAARKEFLRILKEGKDLVIFWNERRTDDSAFQTDYEGFLHNHCAEYQNVTQKNITSAEFDELYGNSDYKLTVIKNSQQFDFEGLKGRLQSSSYSPNIDHPGYPEMIDSLRGLFEKHQENGIISFEYDTEIYCGKMS